MVSWTLNACCIICFWIVAIYKNHKFKGRHNIIWEVRSKTSILNEFHNQIILYCTCGIKKRVSSLKGKFFGQFRSREDCWHLLVVSLKVLQTKQRLISGLRLLSHHLLFDRPVHTSRTQNYLLVIPLSRWLDTLGLLTIQRKRSISRLGSEMLKSKFTRSSIFLKCCSQDQSKFVTEFHGIDPWIYCNYINLENS